MSEFSLTHIQQHIIEELSYGKPMSRRELVEKLERARTTIYNNLEKLQNEKLVEKFSRNNGNRGRPVVLWFIPRHILKRNIIPRYIFDNETGKYKPDGEK